jgi:hypothetical protein
MATALDALAYGFNLLSPVGMGDLNRTSAKSCFLNGGIAWANTPFGPRLVRYVQNRTVTLQAQGTLLSGVGDTAGSTAFTCSATAGSSAKAIVTTGLTANLHAGASIRCLDKASVAGGAPEAEQTVVKANSATLVETDDDVPFSVPILVGDTFNIRSTYNAEVAAIGDTSLAALGVVAARDGLPADYFGFVSAWGNTPGVLVKAATALAVNDVVIADVGRVAPGLGTTSAGILHVGLSEYAMSADIVSDKTTIQMGLILGVNSSTLDVSA